MSKIISRKKANSPLYQGRIDKWLLSESTQKALDGSFVICVAQLAMASEEDIYNIVGDEGFKEIQSQMEARGLSFNTVPCLPSKVNDFSVSELELTPRTNTILHRAGIEKIGQLKKLSAVDLEGLIGADFNTRVTTEATLGFKTEEWGVDISLAPLRPGQSITRHRRSEPSQAA
jgi:antitoxin component HigA of HigAB toxin-antitoxin module